MLSKLKNLFFFDFDLTLIESTSDYCLRNKIKNKEYRSFLIKELETTLDWTVHIKKVYQQLYREGFREKDWEFALSNIELVDGMIELLDDLRKNSSMYIISDSNKWSIDTILKKQKIDIRGWFKDVLSNDGHFNELGEFIFEPFSRLGQKKCNFCPERMCKGSIVESIIIANNESEHSGLVGYFGDSHGDLCGCLALLASYNCQSVAFVRNVGDLMNYEQEINNVGIKVCRWNNVSDLRNYLKDYVTD